MNTRDIVSMSISSEGTGFPVDVLRRHVLGAFDRGEFTVFRYADTVMLLKKAGELWVTHLASINAGPALLRHIGQFCRDVWGLIDAAAIYAPVMNPRIAKLIMRFGWEPVGPFPPYHVMFRLERSRHVVCR